MPSPVFYTEDSCYNTLKKNKIESFPIRLQNKGEISGIGELCVSSKEFVFQNTQGDLVHELCWEESTINAKQTELQTIYTIKAKPDENVFDLIENATINIQIDCKQNIWSLIPRNCEPTNLFCKYKKEGDYLRKIEN